jgi:hypothetical protein
LALATAMRRGWRGLTARWSSCWQENEVVEASQRASRGAARQGRSRARRARRGAAKSNAHARAARQQGEGGGAVWQWPEQGKGSGEGRRGWQRARARVLRTGGGRVRRAREGGEVARDERQRARAGSGRWRWSQGPGRKLHWRREGVKAKLPRRVQWGSRV